MGVVGSGGDGGMLQDGGKRGAKQATGMAFPFLVCRGRLSLECRAE